MTMAWASARSVARASDFSDKAAGRRAAVGLGAALRRQLDNLVPADHPPDLIGRLVATAGIVGVHESPSVTSNGALIELDDAFYVIVSDSLSAEAKLWTVAHEIGHIVIGTGSLACGASGSEEERRCDMFAAELLLPRDDVRAAVHRASKRPLAAAVRDIAGEFGVSLDSVVFRLGDLNLLTGTRSLLSLFHVRDRSFTHVTTVADSAFGLPEGESSGLMGLDESELLKLGAGGTLRTVQTGLRVGNSVRSGTVSAVRSDGGHLVVGYEPSTSNR